MSDVSLLNLPVEILHRIFDHLDGQTIFRSLRCACSQLHAVFNTYDRFELSFTSIGKFHVKLVPDLIRPKNIISLIFSAGKNKQSDKIDLLLSVVDIRQFTRLRSLTISEINDEELNQLLQHINILPLTSLSVQLLEINKSKTYPLLSTAINHPNLRKLCLLNFQYITTVLSWPVQCTLQHLSLSNCTYEEYIFILERCPLLRTFVLQTCTMYQFNNMIPISPKCKHYSQLTSLTMNNCYLSFKELNWLLPLTPSLIYLKLVADMWSTDTLFDGFLWEQLIQTKLPLLIDFHFYFRSTLSASHKLPSLHSMINQYRTPFWLEDKHWYVTCDCVINSSTSQISIYTIPVHMNSFKTFIRCQALPMNDVCYFTKFQLTEKDQINEEEVCMKS